MSIIRKFVVSTVSAVLFAVISFAAGCPEQPIGVFDSGIGGLSVLELLLKLDKLAAEDFVYFGDQANMPYGRYDAEGKADFLRELIVKDAQFVLSNEGHAPAKIVVIACNTATAYGLDAVKQECSRVIGVVNAGVEATLDALKGESAPYAIGVMATPGTISSGVYERTIRAALKRRGVATPVEVQNRGGIGLAEAVENREPGMEMCARTNVIALVEGYRARGGRAPLKALILGCTHYPFVLDVFKATLAELKAKPEYAGLIADDLAFVDPAVYTALACYESLKQDGLLKPADAARSGARVRSFMSVGKNGPLPDSVKYGRACGCGDLGTKIVPMTRETLAPAVIDGIRKSFPTCARELGLDEKPLLRIGAMTDDHLEKSHPATYARTKACFELFRRLGVDIVADTGDIADRSSLDDLRCFRRMFDEVFAGTDCVPFFCIANHDYNYLPNTKKNDPVNFRNAAKALGMESVNPTAVVKGYQFVNVHQCEPKKGALDAAIAKAVAANEGDRPVFVVSHTPPMLTTTDTIHWSSQAVRDVMNKYPKIIALTGHIHTAITWPANIWQGEFTAINLGAHAEYSNPIDGEAVVLEVFADRIDVRRYEAMSGREIGVDDRWSIPWPFDPKTAPYRPEARAKTLPKPVLSAAASVKYTQSANGSAGALHFSPAQPKFSARSYHISFESQTPDGKWNFLGTLNWKAQQVIDEPAMWQCPVSPAMLDGARPHRVTITPVSSLGIAGESRVFALKVPANPMTKLGDELTKITRLQRTLKPNGAAVEVGADGWFKAGDGVTLAVLPKDLSAAVKGCKNVTIVADIASEQRKRPCTFSIGKFPKGGGEAQYGVAGRIYTLPGEFASHRYVWPLGQLKTLKPDEELCIVIREGDAARFKINSVTCYGK